LITTPLLSLSIARPTAPQIGISKRSLDLGICLLGGLVLAVPFLLLLLLLLLVQGRPLFHVSERMAAPDLPFRLIKLRSMTCRPGACSVAGGDASARITPLGRYLRQWRLDEIPQIWNVIRGDMSLVGPRPPLRAYVERFPETYARVLRNRPGLTGLATLATHGWEARILQRCMTPEATDSTYARRCVPRKARLDLIYQQRQSIWLDLAILLATFGRPTRTRRDPQSCINQTRALLDERGGNRPRRFAEGGEP
jgi:lipopolysaccharide/colanic/teichoic acid biosynthesis glycosyltransferase